MDGTAKARRRTSDHEGRRSCTLRSGGGSGARKAGGGGEGVAVAETAAAVSQ